MKLLKSKEAAAAVDIKSWPAVLDTGRLCTQASLCPVFPPRYKIISGRVVFPLFIFNISSVCPSDDLPRKKSPQIYKPPTPEMLAYLDFSVSTTGILAGVKVR